MSQVLHLTEVFYILYTKWETKIDRCLVFWSVGEGSVRADESSRDTVSSLPAGAPSRCKQPFSRRGGEPEAPLKAVAQRIVISIDALSCTRHTQTQKMIKNTLPYTTQISCL